MRTTGRRNELGRWRQEATVFLHEIVATAELIAAAPDFGAGIVMRRDGQRALLRLLERSAYCMSISDIARELRITRQSAGELVRTAERAGRARFLTHPDDRRIVQVMLTPRGRSIAASIRADEARWVIALLNGLDMREMRAAAHVLSVVRQRLIRAEGERGA